MELDPQPLPQILSPCTSCRRRSSADSSSPEFEFWMLRNPSFPQPNLLSADELFSDGVLLPLHHLSNELPPPPQDSQAPVSDQVTEPDLPLSVELGDQSTATSTGLSTSKRWRYIFKKSDKKVLESSVSATADDHTTSKEKDIIRVKDKKRDQKKNGGAPGAAAAANNLVSAAELNINIWPFSRSRSAGNGGTRPRWAAATRKASSAPCSRSNSTGESKSRKWPNSPSRAGVHLGRSSPVWQVRRGNGGAGRSSETVGRNSEKGARKEAGTEGRRKTPAASSGGGGPKNRVLSLNVPMCIGYRHNMSCRNDENSTVSVAAAAGGGRGASGEGVRRSNLFNIRSLFTKKVY